MKDVDAERIKGWMKRSKKRIKRVKRVKRIKGGECESVWRAPSQNHGLNLIKIAIQSSLSQLVYCTVV